MIWAPCQFYVSILFQFSYCLLFLFSLRSVFLQGQISKLWPFRWSRQPGFNTAWWVNAVDPLPSVPQFSLQFFQFTFWLSVNKPGLCSGSSSAGFSSSGFKTPPSAGGQKNASQQWQQNPRPSSGPSKPWMPPNSAPKPQAQPIRPPSQPAKPNYNPSLSVIGGRAERGIRGPGFGKTYCSVVFVTYLQRRTVLLMLFVLINNLNH